MTGSTGRMHGEMPVISPPMKPITINVVMSGIRRQTLFGSSVCPSKVLPTNNIRSRPQREKAIRRVAGPPFHGSAAEVPIRHIAGSGAGGIITVSTMYTVAFAVCTPPQITEALLTLRSLAGPVTVRSAPWTVLWGPAT